ncbi:hypothetical protein AB1A81_10205 [Bdellovibrio bacteriovorus]|uniref:Uncharacterized protein n=1 Tax=Bdellovibrio bacteriovorus (strain ATCC 15356 / DSM 50701 / NCIMB 9529 / HD100) TaxID=264462 RepID=Q6MKZ7_BDEBA|nr:hypothetical protein [Bdellovibrio bacteriovorus]CAE80060.1 hypothetical protein predicted by Glimmer/Critica [Bdellovibrio bacteriovorus HD100]
MKLLATLILLPALSWAHGEDKPGPHGGHIQMPGAFHTEITVDKDQSVHVYLLDMNFANPTIKDSSVAVTAKNKKSEIKYTCSVMGNDHYHCIPNGKVPAKTNLIVQATREKAVGNEAVYKLPLPAFKESKKESKKEDHSHHH